MNFDSAFRCEVARLGVPSVDGRTLEVGGWWTLHAPAVILHASSGTHVGWMEGMTAYPDKLVVTGKSLSGIAQALNEGVCVLAVEMDRLEGDFVLTAGRIRAARIIKPSEYLWRTT